MGRFADNPDYELRWPREVFESELRRMIERGRAEGHNQEWRTSIEWLLRQAFGGDAVPIAEFQRSDYFRDEEPF